MFPENIGPNMSIDETSLSNGELYTFLSNKDAHCKQGSIAAYVKGTKIKDIVEAIMRIPEDIRSKVKEVTMDLSESMRASIEACFPTPAVLLTGSMCSRRSVPDSMKSG